MLDRFPESKDEETKALGKLLWAFQIADDDRRKLEDDCLRWYQINQNYVEAEDKKEDNWRSKVGIPAIFYVIETVAPRLVAQLPEALVKPMRGADVAGARILKPAQPTPWGGYAGYFADPDGHLWEVAWNPAMLPSD